jgi:hypothetical protein
MYDKGPAQDLALALALALALELDQEGAENAFLEPFL